MLSIPIKCPTCSEQHVEQFPERAVLSAVGRGNRLWLHTTCHPAQWGGSESEVRQIREFLGLGANPEPVSQQRWAPTSRLRP